MAAVVDALRARLYRLAVFLTLSTWIFGLIARAWRVGQQSEQWPYQPSGRCGSRVACPRPGQTPTHPPAPQ